MFGSFKLENFALLDDYASYKKKLEALILDAEEFIELCENQFFGLSIDYEPEDYAKYYLATGAR